MQQTFGSLRINGATRQLWRGGCEVHLARKAFDLFALLVEQRPEAVSKGTIHARLWPGTFVADITLHSLVSELRHAIGDDAASPEYIRTIHGFGYAFIGDSEAPSPARRPRGWLIGAIGRRRLFEGDNVIGRGGDDGVIEVPASTVSRRHANLRIDDEAWLEDLGSKNGTFLENRRVSRPVRVADGSRVRLGSCLLTVKLSEALTTSTTRSITRPSGRGI
ncbi:MAG TPA: FHA domain-containing protein [Vicinamibacterales bacterium]|nr:FHA domain-containing protein [Vicinamibacterales bacterium]